MNENELITIWNQQRAIRVKSQLAPTILLSAVLALAATGNLNNSSDSTLKLFVIGLVASGGVFSVSAMVAAIRDSLAVIDSLKALKSLSPLGKSVKKSADQLKALGVLFMAMSALILLCCLVIFHNLIRS